jgi:Pleckstrin homology domain
MSLLVFSLMHFTPTHLCSHSNLNRVRHLGRYQYWHITFNRNRHIAKRLLLLYTYIYILIFSYFFFIAAFIYHKIMAGGKNKDKDDKAQPVTPRQRSRSRSRSRSRRNLLGPAPGDDEKERVEEKQHSPPGPVVMRSRSRSRSRSRRNSINRDQEEQEQKQKQKQNQAKAEHQDQDNDRASPSPVAGGHHRRALSGLSEEDDQRFQSAAPDRKFERYAYQYHKPVAILSQRPDSAARYAAFLSPWTGYELSQSEAAAADLRRRRKPTLAAAARGLARRIFDMHDDNAVGMIGWNAFACFMHSLAVQRYVYDHAPHPSDDYQEQLRLAYLQYRDLNDIDLNRANVNYAQFIESLWEFSKACSVEVVTEHLRRYYMRRTGGPAPSSRALLAESKKDKVDESGFELENGVRVVRAQSVIERKKNRRKKSKRRLGASSFEDETDSDQESGDSEDERDKDDDPVREAERQEMLRHVRHIPKFLRRGTMLRKHCRNSKPHTKYVFVAKKHIFWIDSKDLRTLVIPGDKKYSIPLKEVRSVTRGKKTKVFRRKVSEDADPQLCISIITATRTLDIEARNRQETDNWYQGLHGLIVV